MPDIVELTGSALIAAWRRQAEVWQPSGCVGEHDGLMVIATRLPEPSLNPTLATREPQEPRAAVIWAEEWRIEHGAPGTGIDLPEGRFPLLERALRDRRYREIERRPMMILDEISPSEQAAEVHAVRTPADVAAFAELQVDAFGFAPDVAEAFFPRACLLDDPACIAFLAMHEKHPVACALGVVTGAIVGIFGVAAREGFRRRGYGRAVTAAVLSAAERNGARQAYLQSSAAGLSVYRSLGFRNVCDWVVLAKD